MTHSLDDALVEKVARAIWHAQWEEHWPREGGIEHAHALEIARAALEAAGVAELREENERWQPIETAPNNKSVILGKAGTPLMVTARRHGPISGWRHCHSSDEVCFEPTHWRHYPDPPAALNPRQNEEEGE